MNALGLTMDEMATLVAEAGLERYRGEQILRAVDRHFAANLNEVTALPAAGRERLAALLQVDWPSIDKRYTSVDGTVRYLLRLADGAQVEAVYLPEEVFDGEGQRLRERATFCISTQVGCPVNCQFCLTATLGLKRQLEAGEIVGQVLTLLREHRLHPERDRVNLVYMGMGEPFLNYEAVMRSVHRLTEAEGAGFSPRRITISTAGIVEKIRRFGEEPVRPHLAISLNASTDEQRTRLMPINRGQGGLAALLAAARAFPLAARERLTFEYVLLEGENDTPEDAERLLRLTQGIRCKINLIAWNQGPELGYRTPGPERVAAFQRRLNAAGLPAFVRRPRGRDIYAACGQLKKAEASAV